MPTKSTKSHDIQKGLHKGYKARYHATTDKMNAITQQVEDRLVELRATQQLESGEHSSRVAVAISELGLIREMLYKPVEG